MAASPFPHLNLIYKGRGDAKLEGGRVVADPRVTENRNDRPSHTAFLVGKAANLSGTAKRIRLERQQSGLSEIKGGVPFVVQIPDENDGVIEFLAEKLGLEIVAEYDEGFLIVSSDDLDLQKLVTYANDFSAAKHGATGMASILDIDPPFLSS